MARPHLPAKSALTIIVAAACVLFFPRKTHPGWNPIKTLKKAAGGVGGIVGAPVGGFINAATKPTIRSAENSGHRLIADLDKRMEARIGQIGDEAKATVKQLDKSMEARIYQMEGVIDRSLVKMDKISQKHINEIDKRLGKNIDKVDDVLGRRINQIDGVLHRRIDQVDVVLGNAVADVDARLKDRIDQLDQVTERRIGNADVVATKAVVTFETAISRIIGIGCLLVFVTFLLWRLLVLNRDKWQEVASESGLKHRCKAFFRLIGLRLLLQGGAGGVAALLIYLLFAFYPGGERSRLQEVARRHEASYHESMAAFDFHRAQFHASQLQMLDPDRDSSLRYRGYALKCDLIRDILTRPGILRSPQGVAEMMRLTARVGTYLDNDPDVLTIPAYISWHTGTTREAEYESARLCALAVDQAKSRDDDGGPPRAFPLLPLARNYLSSYLFHPLSDAQAKSVHASLHGDNSSWTIKKLTERHTTADEILKGIAAERRSARFAAVQHILDYNSAVRTLLAQVGPAYYSMLREHALYRWSLQKGLDPNNKMAFDQNVASRRKSAQITVVYDESKPTITPASVTAEKTESELNRLKPEEAARYRLYRRWKHAWTIVNAWRKFDETLQSNYWLAGSSTPLAAFRLNDAICSRSAWFVHNPNADSIAPLLTANLVGALGGRKTKDNKLQGQRALWEEYAEWERCFVSRFGTRKQASNATNAYIKTMEIVEKH